MSNLCRICKQNPRRWEKMLAKEIFVPKILLVLLYEAWVSIKNRSQNAIRYVKIVEDADWDVSCDWCPAGMGVVDKITGNYEGVRIPREHPMNVRFGELSLFGELFTVLLFLITFVSEDQVVSLAEDNMGCIYAIQKFRSRPSYAALALEFARVVREKRITIIPHYMKSKTILADPVSRMYSDPNWKTDFELRRIRLKVPKGKRLARALDGWEEVWQKIVAIERRYSSHYDTALSPCRRSSGGLRAGIRSIWGGIGITHSDSLGNFFLECILESTGRLVLIWESRASATWWI